MHGFAFSLGAAIRRIIEASEWRGVSPSASGIPMSADEWALRSSATGGASTIVSPCRRRSGANIV
jgi:hypothetical protein